MLKDFAISIARTLHDQGYQAYLVGGCVRDLLLGREPGDYDIATDATPEQVMRIFPQTYAVGAQFGVVLVPMAEDPSVTSVVDQADVNHRRHRGKTVEVATFRSDIGYSDGRHPDQVRFSKDPRQDVQRRDFTINGLLLDPLKNEVLDFVGGRKDLDAGIIRAIGEPELRFAEDKLRMLRAVRFTARFGYSKGRKPLLPLKSLPRKFTRSRVNGSGMNLPKCLPKARRGVPSYCSMKPDCCMSFFLKSKP